MSESDGLAKLTEFLKQTRRQAELAIDNLNSQIQILTRENEELKGSIAQIQHEKSEYKRLFEQLKQETSGKWKFKERDDWKCLVDNIQQDRTRLQEENNQLNALLSTTSKQVEELKTEIQKLYSEKDELEEANRLLLADVEELKTSGERPKTITIETDEDENGMNGGSFHESKEGGMSDEQKLVLSPIVDESTGRRLFSFDTSVSPHSLAKRLKEELRRTHSQMEEERKKAEVEKVRQLAEINRLKSAIDDITNDQARIPKKQIAEVRVIHQDKRAASNSRGSSWFGGWLSVMFSADSDAKSLDVHDPSAATVILKV
mmetsp:Transcript_25375/g.27736  ORF Transcript_25375/g.27736 Transcript_25375/m.27736 type:complete len:317 (-) Transcript_25375:171-1121(-)